MLAREHMFLDEGTYAKVRTRVVLCLCFHEPPHLVMLCACIAGSQQLKYLPREPSRLVLLDHRATSYATAGAGAQ